MKRLNEIRSYLRNRLANCKGTMTIFHDPWKGCFGERYYDDSSDSSTLKALHRRIEMGTEIKRQEKKQETRAKNMRYENLLRQHSTTACEIRYNENGIGLHDDRHCQKCISEKEMNRMKITLHEDPLPSDSIKAKCVVFELGCPEAFLQYRDATWALIGVFGGTDLLVSDARITLLSDYSRLQDYMDQIQIEQFQARSKKYTIGLASTKKSHLRTHYSTRSAYNCEFPVNKNDLP